MTSKSITINEHGQITIPKAFREILKSSTIVLEQDNENLNMMKMISIPDVGGGLSDYAKKEFIAFNSAKKMAWEAEIGNKLELKEKRKK